MDQSGKRGRQLGGFVDLRLSQQPFERAVTSIWGGSMPTTMGAQTSTTSTLTSTLVASSAVGGPAHALYARGPPQAGLTSVRPARQAFVSQSVELQGNITRAWPGQVPVAPNLEILRQSGGIRLLEVVSGPSLTGHKLLVGQ